MGIVAVVAVLVILKNNGIGSVPTGPGTATITWHVAGARVNPPPQPFSGTAAGLSISGTTTGANPSNVTNTPPAPGASITIPSHLHLATWTGTFGGTSFQLDVSLAAQTTSGLGPGSAGTFLVTGTFGRQPVNVTAAPGPEQDQDMVFSGTVGNLKVTGTISDLSENATTGKVTVSFNITK